MAKLTGIALGLLLILAPALVFAAEPAGVVLATVGTVTIQRGTESLPATRRTEMHQHDEIRTGDQARAQLRFADGTVTTLGGNTRFRINRFLAANIHSNAAFVFDRSFTNDECESASARSLRSAKT